MKLVTWYPTVKDVHLGRTIPLRNWLLSKPSGQMIRLIEEIRESDDKKARDELKQSLPVCTPAGVFYPSRNDSSLKQFSGFMQLDLDSGHNQGVDPEEAKMQLIELPFIAYAALSVSGKGVWALASVPAPDDWMKRYFAIEDYIYRVTGYVLDPCTDRISQPRFYSFDPDPEINKKPKMFAEKMDKSSVRAAPATQEGRKKKNYPYLRVPKNLFLEVLRFNQSHQVADVLEAYGWTYTQELNRKNSNPRLVYYTRPGKSADRHADWQKSGSVCVNTNTFYCHSTNSTLPAKEHLTPFDIIAYSEFDGNVEQAARNISIQKITRA